jgi:hypothetical protein
MKNEGMLVTSMPECLSSVIHFCIVHYISKDLDLQARALLTQISTFQVLLSEGRLLALLAKLGRLSIVAYSSWSIRTKKELFNRSAMCL